MLTNEKFRFQKAQNGDKTVVLLHGVIDEDSNFEGLGEVQSPVVFNFKNVTAISSIGTRTWVNFMKELVGKDIFYEECPPLVVRQMNMVPSFLGNAQVLSVFVPYVCGNCDTEKLVLVQGDQIGRNVPEAFPCEACKQGEMELDGHPQQYFGFAK